MDRHEEIRKVAYELYEKNGCRGGHELQNWLEAERIVMARHAREEKKPEAPAAARKATKTAGKSGGGTEAEAKKPRAVGKAGEKKTGAKKAAKTAK